MNKENKLTDLDRLDCESEFTKAVPQKIMASDLNPNGVHLYIEQRAYIAKELEEQGYRKMDEITLKLDIGDRTPEEIKQIAKRLSMAMSTTPIATVSLSDNEIRKETAEEILQRLFDMAREQGKHPMSTPVDWLGNVEYLAKEYGVEVK